MTDWYEGTWYNGTPPQTAPTSVLGDSKTLKELDSLRKWLYTATPGKLSAEVKKEMDFRIAKREIPSAFIIATAMHLDDFARQYLDQNDFQPTAAAVPCGLFSTTVDSITPAMIAVCFKNEDILKAITAHPLFYVNETNAEGFTALHLAAHLGEKEAIDILLDAGADPWQKISTRYPQSAFDLAPDAIKAHAVFARHEKEKSRIDARAQRRADYMAVQEKLKRLAAGLAADAPAAAGNLSSIFETVAEETVQEAPAVDTRAALMEALLKSGVQQVALQFVAFAAQQGNVAAGIMSVIDKVNPLAFDKMLMQYGDMLSSYDRGHLHHMIEAQPDSRLKPVFEYRFVTRGKFVSELDFNRQIMTDALNHCRGKKNAGAEMVEVMKQISFSLNLQHALASHGALMDKKQLNEVSEHMSAINRPDMVQVISAHLRERTKAGPSYRSPQI